MSINLYMLTDMIAILAGLAIIVYLARTIYRIARPHRALDFRRRQTAQASMQTLAFMVGVIVLPGLVTLAGFYPVAPMVA